MAEKPKFMVFKVLLLFEVHIQQRWYLTGGNSSWNVIRRKKTFKIKKKFKNKEIHNGCAKMQNNIVAGCIKGWSANLKLKKLSLLKLPLP